MKGRNLRTRTRGRLVKEKCPFACLPHTFYNTDQKTNQRLPMARNLGSSFVRLTFSLLRNDFNRGFSQ